MGGHPKNLRGLLRARESGLEFTTWRKKIWINKDQTHGSPELGFFNVCNNNNNVSQPLKSFTI